MSTASGLEIAEQIWKAFTQVPRECLEPLSALWDLMLNCVRESRHLYGCGLLSGGRAILQKSHLGQRMPSGHLCAVSQASANSSFS